MGTETGLRQDDLLFVLFGLSYAISPEDSFTSIAQPGRLLEQGFVWTTRYILGREHFFSLRGSREPDGHMVFEAGSLLITIEATANPQKPNLKGQIEFFSSEDYRNTVVDQKYHEIWLFVAAPVLDEFLPALDSVLSTARREIEVPIVVWSIDYDRHRHRYFIAKVRGTHSPGIPIGSGIPPEHIELERPRTFPLLSSHLSFPAVCFALGLRLLGEILYPGPERTLREYHGAFPASAVPFSYFSKALGYLSQITPELIEISKGKASERKLRVKRNLGQIDTIQRKLNEIRICESEQELIALVEKYRQQTAQLPPPAEPGRKPLGTLDQFMGEDTTDEGGTE